jgi:DNA-binding IclR family transcriptional regulator
MDKPKLPAQPNNSLINGIECLQRVVNAGEPIGSREVARRMGLTHTRVNRLLGTLAHIGLLDRDSERKYRPGPALHALAAQSMMASRLLPSALPSLLKLRSEGYTVALGTLWEGKVCFLFHERPWQSVEEAILRHELWPAQLTSLGVALLARQPGPPKLIPAPEAAAARLLPGHEPKVTVPFARKHGYAVLRFVGNIVSVGVAMGTPPIAGIAVSGQQIGEEFVPEIAQKLHATAAEILGRLDEPLTAPHRSEPPRSSTADGARSPAG